MKIQSGRLVTVLLGAIFVIVVAAGVFVASSQQQVRDDTRLEHSSSAPTESQPEAVPETRPIADATAESGCRALDEGMLDEYNQRLRELEALAVDAPESAAGITAAEHASYLRVLAELGPEDRDKLRKIDRVLPWMASQRMLLPLLVKIRHGQSIKEFHEVRLKHLGPKHSRTLETSLWLSLLTLPRGERGSLARQTVQEAENLFGPNHPFVLGLLARVCELGISEQDPMVGWALPTLLQRGPQVLDPESPGMAKLQVYGIAGQIRGPSAASFLPVLAKAMETLEQHGWAAESGIAELTRMQAFFSIHDISSSQQCGAAAIALFEEAYAAIPLEEKVATPLAAALVQCADAHRALIRLPTPPDSEWDPTSVAHAKEARRLLNEAIRIANASSSKPLREQFIAPPTADMAALELTLGNKRTALEQFESAINLLKKYDRQDLLSYTRGAFCVAAKKTRDTDLSRALIPHLVEQLEFQRQHNGNNNPVVATSLSSMAAHLEIAGNLPAAYDKYREAQQIVVGFANRAIPGQEVSGLFKYSRRIRGGLLGAIRTVSPGDDKELYQTVWNTRGVGTRIATECLNVSRCEKGQKLIGEIRSVTTRLAKAKQQSDQKKSRDLISRRSELERQLSQLRGQNTAGACTLTEASENFPSNTTIIELVTHDMVDGQARVDAFLVTKPGQELTVERFQLSVVLRKEEGQLITSLASAGPTTTERGITQKDTTPSPMPARITPALIGLEKLLGSIPAGTTNVVICPDGVTQRIPWASQKDGDKYLIEKYTLEFATTARDRLARSKPDPIANPSVLAVGDVRYDVPEYQQRKIHRGLYRQLKETKAELAQLQDIWERVSVLTGTKATAENARKKGRSHTLLHLATHATGSYRDNSIPNIHDQLLSAKISLADQPVSGAELATWDLSNVELLVLSTCSGAAGRTQHGEGTASIARAGSLAGAKAVMANLWPIEDKLVPPFMKRFHQHLHDGLSPENALRQTQLAMIQQGRPTTEWAGWRISR